MASLLHQAIADCGGAAAVAARMEISVQRLWNWLDRGVPVDYAAALESALEGKARRWDMHPADWYRIWPELINADGAPPVPADQKAADPKAA